MLICQPPPVRVLSRHSCDGYYLMWYYNGWHYWYFLPGRISVVTEGEEYRRLSTMVLSMSSGQIDRDQAKAIKTILLTKEIYILSDYWWKHLRIEPGSVVFYDNSINGAEIEFNAVIGNRLLSMTGFSPTSYPYTPSGIIIPPITPIIYGMLYNWYAVDDVRGMAPAGWHVPSDAEWATLVNHLGGEIIAGGKLKEAGTTYWNPPNIGATNEVGFNGRGSGYRLNGIFEDYLDFGPMWGSTEADLLFAFIYQLLSADATLLLGNSSAKNGGAAIRLIKDDDIDPGTLTDYDGNVYNTVKIGTQVWTAANAVVTHYNNGDEIPYEVDAATWAALVTGARCYYDNDPAYE